MLWYWWRRALRGPRARYSTSTASSEIALPPPVFGARSLLANNSGSGAEWCYDLDAMHRAGGFYGNSRRKHAHWSTAHCAHLLQKFGECKRQNELTVCPVLVRRVPRVWFFCSNALLYSSGDSANLATGRHVHFQVGKVSPGVLALVPGATLWVDLDALPSRSSASANGSVRVRISYLTSYEYMGKAILSCERRCTCTPLTLDAHRASGIGTTERNSSIFASRWFPARVSATPCSLRLTVLQQTSSGGHKFKVNQISVMRA